MPDTPPIGALRRRQSFSPCRCVHGVHDAHDPQPPQAVGGPPPLPASNSIGGTRASAEFNEPPRSAMMDKKLFDDSTEIGKDLSFLENLRSLRKEFNDRICEASGSHVEQVLATLRLEATYQLAEFFYLLSARGLRSADQIEALTELHNAYIVELTKDTAKMTRLSVTKDRLLDAMFTADTLPRLLQHWREKPGAIDQSNLARFLATVMSTETCRKVVVACGRVGFLDREKTAYGTVLISSTGTLEQILGKCIRSARGRVDKGGINVD